MSIATNGEEVNEKENHAPNSSPFPLLDIEKLEHDAGAPSPAGSDDEVNKVEELNENPNPRPSIQLEEHDMYVSSPLSHTENRPRTKSALDSPQASSDDEVSRLERLDENPNPALSVQLENGDMHVSSGPRTESDITVKSAHPVPAAFHTFSIHILSLLMSFSVFGTLARLGIHAVTTYPGQSIFPLAWVQAVGCLIMGFTLAMREPITRFYGPLYVGITTGFCGSLTTFSGWQIDVFSAWADQLGPRKLWIYVIIDGLTRLLFTLAASAASFGIGIHLGKRTRRRIPILSPPGPAARWIITTTSIGLYILTIPFFVRLNHAWRPLATAAIMFSFPGTFVRYVLSTQLNSRVNIFPAGTLVANELAIAVLAICHIIQRTSTPPSPISCSILQGYIDGFCGCLSTVSTFIVEIRTLSRKKAWIYTALSIGLGQIILLLILGPAWWTGRIKESNICTFG